MAVIESTSSRENRNPPSRPKEAIWNFLTVLVLFAMLATLAIFWMIFKNPASSLNPFPPPTLPAVLVLPSTTPTIPNFTVTPTITLTPTFTVTATDTLIPPTATPTYIGGELALTPSRTPQQNAIYPFALESDPSMVAASIFWPSRGNCNWIGVGGRVVDMQRRPVTGILVQLGGTVKNKMYNITTLTGTATEINESGYEFTLSDQKPFVSSGKLWVQLFDQQRIPLSPEIHFDTTEDCSRNLIVVNFKQVR